MLELSISFEEIIFTLFSIGTISFSCLAILSRKVRSSITNFLAASMFVCGFIVFVSEPIIGITLAIIYISISSLFLIMTNDRRVSENRVGRAITWVIWLIFIASILIYKKAPTPFIIETNNSHYIGIGEITLLTSLIFLFVISGLISMFESKEN